MNFLINFWHIWCTVWGYLGLLVTFFILFFVFFILKITRKYNDTFQQYCSTAGNVKKYDILMKKVEKNNKERKEREVIYSMEK